MNPTTPREGRRWPGYMLGGRLRTSTAVLLIAFIAIWWLYETYEPAPAPQQVPASEVVPPGFIPDPNYTWAPRTDVRRQTPTTTSTSPTTTSTGPTTTGPTTTTAPGDTPDEPSSTSPQPGAGTATEPAEPPQATDAPGAGQKTRTPAAAPVGPSTPVVSPPQ